METLSKEQLVKDFRTTFSKMDPATQARELMRLDRILNNRPVVLAEPLDEPDRRFKFQNVDHFVSWLKKEGHVSASRSNVYKVIRGERLSAYGYRIKQQKEGGL